MSEPRTEGPVTGNRQEPDKRPDDVDALTVALSAPWMETHLFAFEEGRLSTDRLAAHLVEALHRIGWRIEHEAATPPLDVPALALIAAREIDAHIPREWRQRNNLRQWRCDECGWLDPGVRQSEHLIASIGLAYARLAQQDGTGK